MAKQSQADDRFERLLRALGHAVLRLQQATTDRPHGGVRVFEVRAKLDADNRTSVLLILKGVREGAPVVAFVGGPDLETALIGMGKRLRGDTLRWRDDPPWDGR